MIINEIKRVEEKFSLLDRVPVGVCVLRKDLIILFWNSCLEEWTNIRRQQILKTKITTHFPHLNHPKYLVRLQQIFTGGPPTIFSSQIHKYFLPAPLPDGKLRIQQTTVTAVPTVAGEIYALLVIQDVTDLTQRIHEYRVMRDQALEEIKERKRIEEEHKHTQELLRQQTERERLIARITQHIRQSLKLSEILNTTVTEVRQFLQTDRVIVLRFETDWSGQIIVESVESNWKSLLGKTIRDYCFDHHYTDFYNHGLIWAINDIYLANLAPCLLEQMFTFQVRANLIVPILQGSGGEANSRKGIEMVDSETLSCSDSSLEREENQNLLWGLLIAHHCSGPRSWQPFEIDLLKQLATQLAIAIQQAELYEQLQATNQALQRLAGLDSLTQLANRRRFDEYLDSEWQRQIREKGSLSLILGDIDFFKLYNDTYGHQAGDECLRMVATAIGKATHRIDDLVARYGGEEFAVILPHTDAKGAAIVAQEIQQEIRNLQIIHLRSPISKYVTLSLGITSLIPCPNTSPALLIKQADQALYQAKAQGRDRIHINLNLEGSS